MPELPEVETVRRALCALNGRRITKATLCYGKSCENLNEDEFARALKGQELTSFERRGKFLIIGLSNDSFLISHFRMTGTFVITPSEEEAPQHTRASIELDCGRTMHFNDPRKFGRLWVVSDSTQVLSKLGIEPFSTEFTPEYLQDKFSKSAKPIKTLLLEQDKIAGVGNMYADEALFLSGILPTTPANKLTKKQYQKLHASIVEVLENGIKNNGATVSDYKMPDGSSGEAQKYFFVAHRGGSSCKVCGTEIKRITLGGRGTYFCPHCQK